MTSSPPPPAAKAPPPAAGKAAPPPPAPGKAPAAVSTFSPTVTRGRVGGAQRTMIYGSAGVGKSTLLALAPKVLILDLEGGTREMDVPRISGIETFGQLRSVLANDALFDEFDMIGIDTLSKVEILAKQEVFDTTRTSDGSTATSLEAYGYGKGYQYVYDMCRLVLQDMERQLRRGKHITCVAHDTTSKVPNPNGEDYIRFEPRLQSLRSGKSDVRDLFVENSDHVIFVGYDVAVTKDGKGRGAGTRTIFTTEKPTHIAKVRKPGVSIPASMPYTLGESTIWNLLLGNPNP